MPQQAPAQARAPVTAPVTPAPGLAPADPLQDSYGNEFLQAITATGGTREAAGIDKAAPSKLLDLSSYGSAEDEGGVGKAATSGSLLPKFAEKGINFAVGNAKYGASFAAGESTFLNDALGSEALERVRDAAQLLPEMEGSLGAKDGGSGASLKIGDLGGGVERSKTGETSVTGSYGDNALSVSRGKGALDFAYEGGDDGAIKASGSVGRGGVEAKGSMDESSTQKDVAAEIHAGSLRAGGALKSLEQSTKVGDASLKMDSKGFSAKADEFSTGGTLSGARAAVGVGSGVIGARVGEASEATSVKGASAEGSLASRSVKAHVDEASTSTTVKDAAVLARGGGLKADASAGEIGVGRMSGNSLDAEVGFNGLLPHASASGKDLSTQALSLKDTKASIGSDSGRGLSAAVQDLSVNRAEVGSASAAVDLSKASASAEIDKASYEVAKGKGAEVAVRGAGGSTLLGAKSDFNVGGKVDHASAKVDGLAASAQVDNLQAGFQTGNTSVNLMGREMALPSAGAHLKASAKGDVDLRKGKAEGALDLAGSSVNLAGYELRAPSFAQASGGVNLSEGAAALNVGGKNGLGGSMNLSKGELALNAFGYKADIGGAVRSGLGALSNWWSGGSGAKAP